MTSNHKHVTRAIRLEAVPCDYCRGSQFELFCRGVDREFGLSDQFSIVQCVTCGLIQLNPRPVLADISLIYPPNYGFYNPAKDGWITKLRTAIAIWRGRVKRYEILKCLPPGKIFDVGCATGCTNYPYRKSGSLLDLRERGWEVAGCDIDQTAVHVARQLGLNVLQGMIGDIDWPTPDFDVVRFNHVLEHSISPCDDLKKANSLLKPGGRLVVCVPNINSGCYSMFGSRWSGLDIPRHFYHFTPKMLSAVCDQAGFEIEREHFCSFPDDLVHSLVHVLNARESDEDRLFCSSSSRLDEALRATQVKRLLLALRPVVEYFDQVRWGDNYTLVARKRAV